MPIVTEKNRKWWGLAAIIPSLAMVFTDQSVLPVALPTIQKNLGATNVELEWIINSYLLVTAVLVLAGGKLGDRIGHRKVFSLGMLLFALSSALCGLSPNTISLILARAFQGVGAALMIPASTVLLMSLFPPNERGKAAGINVSVSAVFLIFAPLMGGYFTESLSWRWIFWINLPVAALGLFLIFLFLPKSPKGDQKFDVWGFLFYGISSTLLVVILMQGRDWGWTSLKTATLFLFCLISTFFLLWREKKAKHPFLDLSLFRHPIYKAVNISVCATQFILMITVFRTIYFQDILDWSPIKTGIVTVISSSPVLFMSPIAGKLSDKFGPKLPLSIGLTLITYSFFWLAFFNQESMSIIFPGLIAFGMGIPLIFTPSYTSAMSSVPPKKAGVAFGTISALRSLGSSLGVACIGSFINNVQFNAFRNELQANPETSSLSSTLLESYLAGKHTIKESLGNLSTSVSNQVLNTYKESQVEGFFYSHLAVGLLFIAAFGFVFVLYNRKSTHHLPGSPAEGWD